MVEWTDGDEDRISFLTKSGLKNSNFWVLKIRKKLIANEQLEKNEIDRLVKEINSYWLENTYAWATEKLGQFTGIKTRRGLAKLLIEGQKESERVNYVISRSRAIWIISSLMN